jgi:hypothetical protein
MAEIFVPPAGWVPAASPALLARHIGQWRLCAASPRTHLEHQLCYSPWLACPGLRRAPEPPRCYCDLTADERLDASVDECDVHVRCDRNCKALLDPDPTNVPEVSQALTHWRYHQSMGGCSHGH